LVRGGTTIVVQEGNSPGAGGGAVTNAAGPYETSTRENALAA
jgi:hypothetical protein